MKARSTLLSSILVCVALAAGLGAYWVWRQPGPVQDLTTGTRLAPTRALPQFSLIDHHGRKFGPEQLRGHWTLMFFGYTNCPDFCPTTLTTLAALERRLRAENSAPLPQVVFLSVDAKRDTPAHLAAYVPYFDAQFVGVTAAQQAVVESFARALGVAVLITPAPDGSYSVDHSAEVFVIDPNARIAAILSGPFSVPTLSKDWHHLVGTT